jgi:hypothetical protein
VGLQYGRGQDHPLVIRPKSPWDREEPNVEFLFRAGDLGLEHLQGDQVLLASWTGWKHNDNKADAPWTRQCDEGLKPLNGLVCHTHKQACDQVRSGNSRVERRMRSVPT